MTMSIVVSGSIARDYIMNLQDEFGKHILPDQVHNINVSFLIDEFHHHAGGTAENICYTLGLLGEKAICFGAVGEDFAPEYSKKESINYAHIKVVPGGKTAVGHMITDQKNNQITGFYPGSMVFAHEMSLQDINEKISSVIISPNDKAAMLRHLDEANKQGLISYFDPGQQIINFTKDELLHIAENASFLFFNDYECEVFCQRSGIGREQLHTHVEGYIVTKGAEGAIYTDAGGNTLSVEAIPTEQVVDPTGAGDAFRGGVLRAVKNGYAWKEAMQVGSVCAHYCIQMHGTQRHNFTLADVTKKIEEFYGDR